MWGAVLIVGLVVATLIYQRWRLAGRVDVVDESNDDPALHLSKVVAYGGDRGQGNWVAIQPYMTARDYESEATFYAKLDSYLHEAAERDWLTPRSVVMFPEHIGTWLVAIGEKRGVFTARTVMDALRLVVWSNLPEFLWAWAKTVFAGGAGDLAQASVFQMKGQTMARAYQDVFGMLAREHDITVVAGSIILPEPQIVKGKLQVGDGPLYNVAVVYGPDGRAHEPLVRKAFLTVEELPFVSGGAVEELPVFELPIGRAAVLICADAWYPESYGVVGAKGAELVIVPAFSIGAGSWRKSWDGYSGHDRPDDVERGDIARITLHEAWLKYGMASRGPRAGLRHGMNVFLRGELWDLGGDGIPITVHDGEVIETRYGDGAAVVNVWM